MRSELENCLSVLRMVDASLPKYRAGRIGERKNRAAETRRKNREGLSKRLSAIVTITRLRVAEERLRQRVQIREGQPGR